MSLSQSVWKFEVVRTGVLVYFGTLAGVLGRLIEIGPLYINLQTTHYVYYFNILCCQY